MTPDGTRRATFVSTLAASKSVADAAKAAGISDRTAARWHAEPDVRDELERLRRATLEHARTRLLGLVDEAADTLAAVMGERTGAPAVSAARTVLAQALRLDERVELERRIAELESYASKQQEAQRGRWPA